MNSNWTKILLFSLLFGAIGFILGRLCGHGCGGHRGCERDAMECHGKSQCMHGGGCCAEGGGHCDKPGCDHEMGAACCMKGGHGMHGDPDVQGMVHQLRASGYQGDTVITYPDCTVKVGIHGDKTLVEVERKDSVVVEEHGH